VSTLDFDDWESLVSSRRTQAQILSPEILSDGGRCFNSIWKMDS